MKQDPESNAMRAPCGCGGASILEKPIASIGICRRLCLKCGMRTPYEVSEEKANAVWDTAMGRAGHESH